MFQKCPKCGYARKPGEIEAPERCPACGLIFAKYLEAQQRKPAPAPAAEHAVDRPALIDRLLYVPARGKSLNFYGRCIAYAFFSSGAGACM